jgi:hypothetical protein
MRKHIPLIHFFLSALSPFIFGCGQPTEFDGKLAAHSPNELIASLNQAYEEKNLKGYLSLFSEDSHFLSGGDSLWGKAREQEIHQKMFAAAKTIELSLTEGWNEEATETNRRTVCHYYLQVQMPGTEMLTAQGQVELGLAMTSADVWQISSFRELETGLQKPATTSSNASAVGGNGKDYFPLRVGNRWSYEEIYWHYSDFETVVKDSMLIRGNLYYYLDHSPVFADGFFRVDSLQQFRLFMPADSSELTIFRFNAEIGDSLILQLSDDDDPMIIELVSRKDAATVPAGTFRNVLEFLLTDYGSGSRFVFQFAEGIGLIRERVPGEEFVLKSAYVNGELIVSVEEEKYDWTEIKRRF